MANKCSEEERKVSPCECDRYDCEGAAAQEMNSCSALVLQMQTTIGLELTNKYLDNCFMIGRARSAACQEQFLRCKGLQRLPTPGPVVKTQSEKDGLTRASYYFGGVGVATGFLAAAAGSLVPFPITGMVVVTLAYGTAVGLIAARLGILAIDPIEGNFTKVARPRSPSPPKITLKDGFSRRVVAALNAMLANQAEGVGLSTAMVTAINRSQGAVAAGDVASQSRQLAAARQYSRAWASNLARAATLRSNAVTQLRNMPVADFSVSEIQALSVRNQILDSGWPQPFLNMLTRYGITGELRSTFLNQFTSRLYDIPNLTRNLFDILNDRVIAVSEKSVIKVLQKFATS